jgi:hypothetical protein
VSVSSRASQTIALPASAPHISADAISCPHTAGLSGRPKIMQRTPAGLPCGMPGMAELMEGAMQQAPQPGRQFMV